jgi:succinoglycan biosynthesis transport protein ExoP
MSMPMFSSESAGSDAMHIVDDLGPEVLPDSVDNSYRCDAIADGLWHQAQAVFGAIARATNKAGQPVRAVGLTSCYRHEGVSTVSAVVALAAACQRKVLLLDANLTHPSIHRRFRVDTAPGVLQAIGGEVLPTDCIQTSSLGVSVITAGCEPGPAATFLRADLALPLLQNLALHFDLILLDLPAISDDSSALELSTIMDGVVFVVESERVHRQAAQRTMSRLQQSGVQLIGAVFNKRRDYTPGWLYRML